MTIPTEFKTVELDRLRDTAHRMKDEGWRFIQTHAVYNEPDVDLYYSFMKDGKVVNWRVEGVTKDQPVPSITDIFLAAFVFENEARELFGVDMRDIAIDFQGGLYAPAESEPMRVITPEQKAAIDKARKAAAAKAAKASAAAMQADAVAAGTAAVAKAFVMTEEKLAKFEQKLEGRTAEQIEKARACLAAKLAGASSAEAPKPPAEDAPVEKAAEPTEKPAPVPAEAPKRVDAELEHALGILGGDKAAKVRAALAKRAGVAIEDDAADSDAGKAAESNDSQLESMIKLLNNEKAEKVREALARRASQKGGE